MVKSKLSPLIGYVLGTIKFSFFFFFLNSGNNHYSVTQTAPIIEYLKKNVAHILFTLLIFNKA